MAYIYDICTVLYVVAEVRLISQLEKRIISLDRMELMENFFICSTVIKLVSCAILRNVIIFLKVN